MLRNQISVVLPTYNRATTVGRSIESVLDQAVDVEVIVVDDGSTDNTKSVIAALKDDRVKYIRQQNAGSSAARARGVQEAIGHWLLFLDSDDYLLPGMLTTLLDLARKSDQVGFVFCECWFEDIKRGTRSPAITLPEGDGRRIAQFVTIHSQCYNCRFLIRRSAYDAIGGYDPEIRLGAPELMVFVPLFSRFAFARTPERLAVVCDGAKFRLSRQAALLFDGWSKVVEKLARDEDILKIITPVLPHARAQQLILCGESLYSQNEFHSARVAFISAIRSDPFIVVRRSQNPATYIAKSYLRQMLGLRNKN